MQSDMLRVISKQAREIATLCMFLGKYDQKKIYADL